VTASRVEIRLKSGSTLAKQVDIPRGDPRNPMTAEGVADKVKRFAAKRDQEALNRLIGLSLELESLGSIRELTSIV
jgi:2-methylcitrate dehydratase PrpD